MTFFLGVDLGQPSEPTAIAVIESDTLPCLRTEVVDVEGWTAFQPVFLGRDGKETRRHPSVSYALRHVERLGETRSYPEIARRVAEIASRLPGARTVVDATAVGSAVTAIFGERLSRARFLHLTGGDATVEDRLLVKVPKAELVSTAMVILQTGRLKIARGLPHADLLVRELLGFRLRVALWDGRSEAALWREGASDDLVLSLAAALWLAEREPGIPRPAWVGRSDYGEVPAYS